MKNRKKPREMSEVLGVAVCCSVLQCVAVCCSVSLCVLQCVAVCCSVLQCATVCCSVLQCVAVCCSVNTSPKRCLKFLLISEEHVLGINLRRQQHMLTSIIYFSE